FSKPTLYGNIEDKLVERFTDTRDYSAAQPGKPTYDTIDVGQYLQDKAQARRGLFVLHLRSTSPRRAPVDAAEDDREAVDDEAGIVQDTRLILVTAPGFIRKPA